MIPLRRLISPEIAELAARIRQLEPHPSMAAPLVSVRGAPAGDSDETCRAWLRARGRELAWIDRMIANYEGRPLHPLGCHSRKSAMAVANEFDALTMNFDPSGTSAAGLAAVAMGLAKHIGKVLTLLEAFSIVRGGTS